MHPCFSEICALQTRYDPTGSQLATKKNEQDASSETGPLPQPGKEVQESTVLHEEHHGKPAEVSW